LKIIILLANPQNWSRVGPRTIVATTAAMA
jgi:hypothetical protein